MKKPNRLPTVLRVFFNVCYWFLLAASALIVVVVLFESLRSPDRNGKRGTTIPLFNDVPLSITNQTKSLTAHTAASTGRDIEVSALKAHVNVNPFSSDRELATTARWAILPPFAVLMIGALLVCRLLRDLCAHFERGEVFTDDTLRLVRNIGLLYVLGGVGQIVASVCSQYFVVGYLARSATLSGIKATFDASLLDVTFDSFSTSGIIEGMLILVLTEAFRQGLALKQEAALTV
jgi:hypothetical protein